MEQQLRFEQAEEILSWREMKTGVYKYHGIECRGKTSYDKPMSVVTLETKERVKAYYAPASLYWELIKRKQTSYIRYDGVQKSRAGYQYPVFKFAN